MKKKTKEPYVPAVRNDTIRHQIVALLQEHEVSARQLSMEIGIAEKEVFHHLEHIRIMIHRAGGEFLVRPATCRKCEFVFRKRDRLAKPGKCPVCRGEHIDDPLFSIR